jgi:hypothetical protein
MPWFEFKSGTFWLFYLYLFSYGESRFLVPWCAGDKCGLAGSDEDCGRSRRPGAADQGWSSTGRVLSGRVIERMGDAVCGLYHA